LTPYGTNTENTLAVAHVLHELSCNQSELTGEKYFAGHSTWSFAHLFNASESRQLMASMDQAVLLAAIVVAFLAVIYLSGRKKDGFVRHFSRSDFMRDLNKKMEAEMDKKAP
jgi:hypothetical protein